MTGSTPPELDDVDIYRALVEGIPAILYIDRPDEYSTNYFTSPQAVDLLGYTPQEWGTTPDLWLRKLHPDDGERVRAENDRSNRTGEPFRSEYRLYAKDGRIVWVRDEAVLVRDPGGQPLHWRGVILDITAQKEAEDKLRWSLDVLRHTIQERRELSRRLEQARELERRRIAADIHDDPIQVMSAVDMRLQLLKETPGPVAHAELGALQLIVRQSIDRLRSLLFELRPTALDRDGLAAALRLYLEHSAEETGWTFAVSDALEEEPDPQLRAMVYRIAQEAIANARKHAGATHIDVVVATSAEGVSVSVSDDGTGFDPEEAEHAEPGHLGLSTMVERAELLGGWCRISSQEGAGTTVDCWLPTASPVDGSK